MNKITKILPLLVLVGAGSGLTGCSKDDTIYIFTAHEPNRIELWNEELKAKFPDKNIEIVYKDTGALMAEFQANGTDTDADIFVGIEITNAETLLAANENIFADLSDYDTSNYVDEVLEYQHDVELASGKTHKGHKKYHIQDKEAGCIVYSKSKLAALERGVPTSYEDLKTFPEKSIIMPNPKSSGTGYYFYNGYASTYGKDAAISYFSSLKSNAIKEFSSSGSGPVKGVNSKEIAVGLGMHFQAVEYANKNNDIGITYFSEGSPYTLYTMGMINGKQEKEGVKEVYDYFFSHVNYLDNCKIVPETIYKEGKAKPVEVPNWKSPSDYGVDYTNMKNLLDPDYKQTLLDAWNF